MCRKVSAIPLGLILPALLQRNLPLFLFDRQICADRKDGVVAEGLHGDFEDQFI